MNESCRIAGSRFRPYASSTPEGDREQDRRFGLLCFGACPIANLSPDSVGEGYGVNVRRTGGIGGGGIAAAGGREVSGGSAEPAGGESASADRASVLPPAGHVRVGLESRRRSTNQRGPAEQGLLRRAA